MTLLLLSLISLVLGAVFVALFGASRGMSLLADAFVAVAVGGLVFLHILPQTFHTLGFLTFVACLIGISIPNIADRFFHQPVSSHAHVHVGLPFAVGALVLHALLDGTALTERAGDDFQHLLAIGVILHRFPVGIAAWRWVKPHYGLWAALLAVFGVGFCTTVGVYFGDTLHAQLSSKAFMFVQTVVAGSLLHVLLHEMPHIRQVKKTTEVLALLVGVALGIASLLLVEFVHKHGAL